MPVHDVIVVGADRGNYRGVAAGPRGAAPAGARRRRLPRQKICAGWVTLTALADLEIEPDKYPLTIRVRRVRAGIRGRAPRYARWRAARLRYGIIRREFDHFLLERAATAGADVRVGRIASRR